MLTKEFLLTLLNKNVKVDRGGPESRGGKLLAVGDDYIVLLTKEDGIVYYQIQHIKSITENSKNLLNNDVEMSDEFKFVTGTNLNEVLGRLIFAWVKINRGGPESFEGVLDNVTSDRVTIISKEEIVHVSLFHLRNFSYGLKPKKKKENQQPPQENENNGDNEN